MSNWNIFEWAADQLYGKDEELTPTDCYDTTAEDEQELEFSNIVQEMVNEGRLGNNCRAKIEECIRAKRNFNNRAR